ncbi:transglutaminase domain-containing protein [Flavobacterium sp. SUN052]|uniref:transglutaminase domain-containing protein n=1 Tax=Flavobacterium sp. SUN052 TaxID=3002441 RepID=UPI00237E1010|nr:transglutaminase domain-containing protein [Flavobacterium sp. SUN052]MEC4003777.1 transglutaminase domain-containing protein [Flavobacterium sp. SUN052]
MKKIIAFCILFVNVAFAQTAEKKVWDLLLSNKRDEARKLFDKELKSKEDSNVDYLILDAMLEYEMGKMAFGDEYVLKFIKTCKQRDYLYPLWYKPYIMDNPNSSGYNDYTYKKIDEFASSEIFSNDPIVIYFKAVCDRKRKNIEGFNAQIKKLNAIEDWQYCGVFENLNDSGLETEYEPEIYAKNDKLFDANSNGKMGWYIPTDKQQEGYHYYTNESEYGDGIIYSQVFVDAPSEKDAYLNFGTSSSIKIFVNDVEIYANNMAEHTDLNAFRVKFKLPKGTNRLLVKFSTGANNDNFFLSLTDENNAKFSDVVIANAYKPYNKSTLEQLNPVDVNPSFENFFKDLIAKNPDNVLYKILLFDSYSNNSKNEEANDIIEELIKKYPKSSLIQVMQMTNYSSKKETQKVEEIAKNMEVNDENYYYNILNKIQDQDWMRTSNIVDLEKYREKTTLIKSDMITILFDFILASRKSDVNLMLQKIDELFAKSDNNEFYITTFSSIYEQLKNDKSKVISMLEDLLSKKENLTALNQLKRYYNAANRKDEVQTMVHDVSNRYAYSNDLRTNYIEILDDDKKYNEALVEVDRALSNFPYSFSLMEKKGTIYNNLNNLKEAEKFFRQSLSHNSGNSSLRKKLYDITKTPDEIEEIATKDIYKLIKQRRNSTLKGDFGVTTLLDEYIVNVLPEGGRKSKVTFLYEITSEKGIEEMKEYDIQSYSNNVLKSEIVKQDGSIVPAEEGDGKLVFTDLKIGDVLYIQYERYENSTGRFYKDFDLSCYFNSYYPAVEAIFGFIYPQGTEYISDFINGTVPSTTKKVNNKTCMIWKRSNVAAMALNEAYAPNFSDLTNTIRVSTIKTWKEISNWYSDLVKKNLKLDKITKNTFAEIFPNGVAGISQEEIAKKIYAYIENNIKYSSLDFRQSGYVPQKPSKTITTKLGDCKDVSTLFVALSELAGLKANLVLVTTNDNGFTSMLLPSNDFNHCIVKVKIDDKDYFLELTDKYLPFRALPSSLYHANALVISFDKAENEKSKIISIPFDNALKNTATALSVITIDDKSKNFVTTFKVQGANKSYYNELFSDATTEDVRKKKFEEDYNAKLKKVVTLQSSKVVKNEMFDKDITFETQFNISERLQTVGNLKITDIPFLDKVYTRDIIALETRKYDIDYFSYETSNEYQSEIILNIPADKKFTEIPESKTFTFKGHKYQITFEQLKPNSLKVTRTVALTWDNITTAEYADYKKYVDDVIAAEEQIVGFK